jgi:hypothetical protein
MNRLLAFYLRKIDVHHTLAGWGTSYGKIKDSFQRHKFSASTDVCVPPMGRGETRHGASGRNSHRAYALARAL